jgi:hypothetical protein
VTKALVICNMANQIDNMKGKRGARGARKYCYTIGDVSVWSGKKEQVIRNDVHKGKVDLKDFWDVVRYVMRSKRKDEDICRLV